MAAKLTGGVLDFALSPAGGKHPQSPAVTAPSGREPLVSANFGHRIVGRDDPARRNRNRYRHNPHNASRAHSNNLNK